MGSLLKATFGRYDAYTTLSDILQNHNILYRLFAIFSYVLVPVAHLQSK